MSNTTIKKSSYNHNRFLLKPTPKRTRTSYDQFVILPTEKDEVVLSQQSSRLQMIVTKQLKKSTKNLTIL